MTSWGRRSRGLTGAGRRAATILILLLSAGAAAAGHGAREFVFEELNGVYPDLEFQGPPMSWGPFRMQLHSPRFTVLVFGHRVKATPLGRNRHRVSAEVELSAHGRLIADIQVTGIATRREGDAAAPRQTLAVEGVVEVVKDEGGYAVTVVEVPPELEVEVHSALAEGLVTWCRGNSVLAWTGVECGGLERRLTRVAVPLPQPGERFRLDRNQLREPYATELDEYLEATAQR